jgi:hypothetical protein
MINVSSLTQYVDEQRLPLIRKAVLAPKSADLFNLQTGVKSKAALNILTTDVVFGDGSTCGWNPEGTNTLSQREIEVGKVKVNMNFCDRTLLDYWAGYEVKVAAGKETLPFEEAFVADILAHVNEEVEKAIWQGDKSGTGNLAIFDGLLKILDAETDVIKKAAVSGNNIAQEVYDAYANIPLEILHTASVVCGEDTFRAYIGELNAANLYHYDPKVDEGMSIVIPGTSTRIYGVPGLNGTKKIVAGDLKGNFFYGTDLEGDQEVFDLWYSKDNQEFRLAIKFNAGVQVAFPDQIVVKTIA